MILIMTIIKLMEEGEDLPGRYDFSGLRHIATVGNALAPELFYWIRKNLGHSPHDTWWMSETGMICMANFPSMDIKPGSMGKPFPGIEAAVLDEKGEPLPPMSMGELGLKVPWPAILAGIWGDNRRYSAYFRFKGWFATGDMAVADDDGYYYHQGRIDDLIKVGEKLIGPYEIEQILYQHPAVCEAAVISKSTMSGESYLKAFITIAEGFTPSNKLNQEIKAFVKVNFSADTPLKEIAFTDRLPKTRSGLSSEACSKTGPNIRHGLHHSAQKSTITGTSRDFSITAIWKLSSLTSNEYALSSFIFFTFLSFALQIVALFPVTWLRNFFCT
jgi:acetyl-CoA synthetase